MQNCFWTISSMEFTLNFHTETIGRHFSRSNNNRGYYEKGDSWPSLTTCSPLMDVLLPINK
mgnify:CR=1 FL=1